MDEEKQPTEKFISMDNHRHDFVRFFVSNRHFRFRKSLVAEREGTFMHYFVTDLRTHADKLECADGYVDETDEYVFLKSPHIFGAILEYLTDQGLHFPKGTCGMIFLEELQFWGVSSSEISDCCRQFIPPSTSRIEEDRAENEEFASLCEKPPEEEEGPDQFVGVNFEGFRRSIWAFFEDPTSSKGAKIFSLLSVGVVLLSVVDMVLATMPELQVEDSAIGSTEMVPQPFLVFLEAACIVWFTLEYSIRLAIAGDRKTFVKVPFNVVDVLSVMPFYLELTLQLAGINTENLEEVKGALMMLRILRVLRVARIFKVAKYSSSLQNLGGTFTSSMQQFGMILMFIAVIVILFSTTIYFMEKDVENTQYSSIPASFWWCIITMTTVGYGDMTPTTFAGKLVASICSVSGVIVLAFPITLIIDNFGKSRTQKALNEEAALEAKELEEEERERAANNV